MNILLYALFLRLVFTIISFFCAWKMIPFKTTYPQFWTMLCGGFATRFIFLLLQLYNFSTVSEHYSDYTLITAVAYNVFETLASGFFAGALVMAYMVVKKRERSIVNA